MSTRILSAADPLKEVRALVARYFAGTVAALAAGAMLLFSVLPAELAADERSVVIVAYAVLATLAFAVTRLHRAGIVAMLGLMIAAEGCTALTASFLGWGLASPAMDVFALLTCLVCMAADRALGIAAAAVAAADVFAIAFLSSRGAASPDAALRVLLHLLSIGAGAGGGMLMSRVVGHFVHECNLRERRFRGLLGIAADAYWETDAEHLAVRHARQTPRGDFIETADVPRRHPWTLDDAAFDRDADAALLASMDLQRPFRELPVVGRTRAGREAHLLVSGEPRRDAAGHFCGYWGVTHDITPTLLAQRALRSTQNRWRDLFAHLPAPLVLHREGRVLEANPSALALLGFSDAEAIVGYRFADSFDAESAGIAARRLAKLDAMPPGGALKPAEFRLRGADGRLRMLRGTSVRIDADGGPATLSLFIDETERMESQERLRNSESLLSHLVATSPDLIMLSELEGGRFAMVNESFVRLSGWPREEAVGRRADELGLWVEGAERERLVDALAHAPAVQEMPVTLRTRGGAMVALRLSAARFSLNRKAYLVINARDVSIAERERLEREAILDNASIGIAFTRGQRFVRVNARFEAMHGWPTGTLVGEEAQVVWPQMLAAGRLERDLAPGLARGEPVEIERSALRRDGTTFVARMIGKAVDPTRPMHGGTIWIVDDVTERRAVERALAAARDEAEAASRAKSAFLANTSHEIRTPLNALLGLAQLARSPGVDAMRRQHYVEQIGESAETLSQILTDILDLSKIEAGQLSLDRLPFDLPELLAKLQQAYATLADAKGLRLELVAAADLPQIVVGDPVRVRQILTNFLHNALKFTAEGRVRWSAHGEGGDAIRFEVSDTGPGIDQHLQDRLFRPFSQADDSVTRRFGGTGLGLSICRQLAQLMRGEVGVRSIPGHGSTFWASLPLSRADAHEVQTTSGGYGGELLAGARVLLVEDNPVNMMIGVALLEQWGVVVEQAGDGRQAIDAVDRAAARGRPFDLVLMDMQMPVMGGFEATTKLRLRYGAERLPIIALTAAALVSERETALAAGMNEFITKPIDPARLKTAISRVLSARDAV